MSTHHSPTKLDFPRQNRDRPWGGRMFLPFGGDSIHADEQNIIVGDRDRDQERSMMVVLILSLFIQLFFIYKAIISK